jgi:hypothetical protein
VTIEKPSAVRPAYRESMEYGVVPGVDEKDAIN